MFHFSLCWRDQRLRKFPWVHTCLYYNIVMSSTAVKSLALTARNLQNDDALILSISFLCHHADCSGVQWCLYWYKRTGRMHFIANWYVSCLTNLLTVLHFLQFAMRMTVILLLFLSTTIVTLPILPTLHVECDDYIELDKYVTTLYNMLSITYFLHHHYDHQLPIAAF